MKGYLTSYLNMFQEPLGDACSIERVQIPLIQRDFAQGRSNAVAGQIRRDFVEVLVGAVGGGQPVGLDFIYGKVNRGVFQPLDGQQRLTTLFLIHWYFASLAGVLDSGAEWTRFTYETRPSARFFCESLVRHPLPPNQESPATWIQDQPWYLYTWRNDPTIQSMLVMVEAVHEEARRHGRVLDAEAAWARLADAESPAVFFYLLPLEDMESEEDLYIKMNSRGKPLTEFENFKAHFEEDICLSARADEFAHRIDGPWADLMWPIHGGDNIVDDEFIRFIDYITEICELRDGTLGVGRLGQRAKAVFGPDNPKSGDHIEFLFRAFDVLADGQRVRPSFVGETFERVFSLELPESAGYDPERAVLFGSSGVNLFEQCCHAFDSQRYGRREFTLQDSLLLYAVLLHLTEETEDFNRRARILRNLLAASVADEIRRPNMPGLVKDVEAVIIHGDLDSVSKLSSNQVQNERAKVAFLAAHPDLARAVFRLEDHPLLRGTLSAFEFTADSFERRVGAFELAFSDPELYLDLTGALLATGDYQRRRPRTQSWQFGTADPKNQSVWRYLLTEASSDDLAGTRAVLARFLDDLATSSIDIRGHLEGVAAASLAEREERAHLDWRYYLIKYPAMRGSRDDRHEGKTGIYWGVDGELGYSLCMLRTYQLNGFYRDPILLEVWRSSGARDRVLDPWFSGYVTDSRWLRLARSQVGLRCVSQGFELKGPEDEDLQRDFLRVCSESGVVTAEDGRFLLQVPQADAGGGPIDCVDRVVMGAAFVKELVEAGL